MPVVASQIRAVVDPVATRLPSGDQATLLTVHLCPSSTELCFSQALHGPFFRRSIIS